MKTRKFLAFVLVIAMVLGSVSVVFGASGTKKGTATTITLEKYTGSVTITNASGKEVKPREGAKLYSGYTIKTGKKSSANLLLDDKSALLIESSSKVQLNKSGKKIAVMLMSGTVLDVSEKLAKDQTLDIYTTNMVTGVRGTVPEVSHDSANDKSSSTTLQGTTEATEKTGGYSLKSTKIPAGYGASTTTEQVAVNRAENTGNQFVDAQQLPSQQEQFAAERKTIEALQTETKKYTEVDRALQSNPEHQQGYEQAFFPGPRTPQDMESFTSMIMQEYAAKNQAQDQQDTLIKQAVQDETPATQGEKTDKVFEKEETLPAATTTTVTPVTELPQSGTQTPATPATTGGGGSDSSSSGDSGGGSQTGTLTITVPNCIVSVDEEYSTNVNADWVYVYSGSHDGSSYPDSSKMLTPEISEGAQVYKTTESSVTLVVGAWPGINGHIDELSFNISGVTTHKEVYVDPYTQVVSPEYYWATITNSGQSIDLQCDLTVALDKGASKHIYTSPYLFNNNILFNETIYCDSSDYEGLSGAASKKINSGKVTINVHAEWTVSTPFEYVSVDTDLGEEISTVAVYSEEKGSLTRLEGTTSGSLYRYTTDAEGLVFGYNAPTGYGKGLQKVEFIAVPESGDPYSTYEISGSEASFMAGLSNPGKEVTINLMATVTLEKGIPSYIPAFYMNSQLFINNDIEYHVSDYKNMPDGSSNNSILKPYATATFTQYTKELVDGVYQPTSSSITVYGDPSASFVSVPESLASGRIIDKFYVTPTESDAGYTTYTFDSWYLVQDGDTSVSLAKAELTDDGVFVAKYKSSDDQNLYTFDEVKPPAGSQIVFKDPSGTGTINIYVPNGDQAYASVNVYSYTAGTGDNYNEISPAIEQSDPNYTLYQSKDYPFAFGYLCTVDMGISEIALVPIVNGTAHNAIQADMKEIDAQTVEFISKNTGDLDEDFFVKWDVTAMIPQLTGDEEKDIATKSLASYYATDLLFRNVTLYVYQGDMATWKTLLADTNVVLEGYIPS